MTGGTEDNGVSLHIDTENERGVFFSMEELAVIFPIVKKNESFLDLRGRQVLNRIERILYDHLSIEDIENRLRGSGGYG